jgi:signal transduction histidine kinase
LIPARRLDPTGLDDLIRGNLISDFVAQAITCLALFIWVPYTWAWIVWGVRWVVFGAIGLSLHQLRTGRRTISISTLTAGHMIGVATLAIAIPELAPMGMLILVGDLYLATFLSGIARQRFVAVLVVSVTAVPLASNQDWIGLASQLPQTVSLTLICLLTFSSGVGVPLFRQQHYYRLRDAVGLLQDTETRLSLALQAERRSIATSLEAEPLNDLAALNRTAHELAAGLADPSGTTQDARDRLSTVASDAVSTAQRGAARLRDLSHGIAPIGQSATFGDSVRTLCNGVTVRRLNTLPEISAPDLEMSACILIRELATLARATDSKLSLEVGTLNDGRLRMEAGLTGVSEIPESVETLLRDRFTAHDGTMQWKRTETGMTLLVFAQSSPHNVLPNPRHSHSTVVSLVDRQAAVLDIFGLWGWRMILAGLSLSLIVLAVTRSLPAIAVVSVLVALLFAASAIRRCIATNRVQQAAVSICALTSVAALALVLLIPPLLAVSSLVATLPLILSLPFFSARQIKMLVVLQAFALTAVAAIGFLEVVVLPTVVPLWVSVVISMALCAGMALMLDQTLAATTVAVEAASADVRSSIRNTVTTADELRRSVERDLHDGAQQVFVAVALQLRSVSRLIANGNDKASSAVLKLQELISSAARDIRNVVDGVVTRDLSPDAVRQSLLETCDQLGVASEIEVAELLGLSPDRLHALLMCCQEAIQNVAKHAGPNVTVCVQVAQTPNQVRFSVADNGVGFVPVEAKHGFGLESMRLRLAAAEGDIDVDSSPGVGTTVSGFLTRSM